MPDYPLWCVIDPNGNVVPILIRMTELAAQSEADFRNHLCIALDAGKYRIARCRVEVEEEENHES